MAEVNHPRIRTACTGKERSAYFHIALSKSFGRLQRGTTSPPHFRACAMTDWRAILRPGQRGVAVEGDDDKQIIEAFLDAGMRSNLWSDWTQLLHVEPAGNFNNVLKEIKPDQQGIVWDIVDRDWHSDEEIAELK